VPIHALRRFLLPASTFQPIHAVLRSQGRSMAAVARLLGVDYLTFRSACYGLSRPSKIMKERTPALLGVELERLFTDDKLAEPKRSEAVAAR
jgi:lambda repressor-like predicted transcriptional regulator